MKVFISSVTYMLKDERAALPPFLRLFDDEALRFEDFEAQDRSSREACLAGVEVADVYVLLLGPRYGTPFPDTGLSPTAEEFRRARQRGIPILVFNKIVDEMDEPSQAGFKSEVGHYVNGRLWRSFTDPASCNQAVGEALKALSSQRGPISRTVPGEPVAVPWLSEIQLSSTVVPASGFVGGRRSAILASASAPVLELHVLGIGASDAPSLRQLEGRAASLARDMRRTGFVTEGDQLVVKAGDGFGWVVRPPASSSSGPFPRQVTVEQFRGALIDGRGVCAFLSLDSDVIGALVDQQSLQSDLAELFGVIAAHIPEADSAAVAAALSRADRIGEGDPRIVGTRNSGQFSMTGPAEIRAGGDFLVPTRQLVNSFGDVGADLAHALIVQLRERR